MALLTSIQAAGNSRHVMCSAMLDYLDQPCQLSYGYSIMPLWQLADVPS
jgi:hypothetical protein